jgi:HSP20 family protein
MTDINVQKVAKAEDRKLPVFEEMERVMQQIRERAFAVFSGRGYQHGSALNDWLAAERELCWPACEFVEHEQDYALSVALAGFEPKDITVTATPREIIVSATAERSRASKAAPKGEQVRWSEFRSDNVYRRVELPIDVQVAKVSADYANGLLKIVAPKAQLPVTVVPISAAA